MIPRKILAMKLRAMGDTILMTAPLMELRRAYPEAEIHVAVLTAWAPLLENHPAVDRIWTYERHKEATSRAKALARLGYRLRQERFDLAVNFHASPSSATLCFATGARTRSIHFHGHKDKNRHSTVEVPGKGTLKPIIERDMDTVRALGLHVPAGRLPRIYTTASERREAQTQLDRQGLHGPLLTIGIGASRPSKAWPVARYANLAARWCEQEQGCALVVASADEQEQVRDFLFHLEMVNPEARARIAVQSRSSVRQLAAMLELASVHAGNDSGPKHLAVAMETPTVTVFGPEQPFEWHPYPLETHPYLFIDNLPCRRDADPGKPAWCGIHLCKVEEHRCMKSIGVDAVFEKATSVARRDRRLD